MEVGDWLAADPLRAYTTLALAGVLVLSAVVLLARITSAWLPIRTWLIMLPILFAPLWLGTPWWATFVTLVGVFGFKEFAKTTGLYRELTFVLAVYLFIVFVNVAALLREDAVFITLPMWSLLALTLLPIMLNRTDDMIQWFALSVMGFTFYGYFLAHLVWLAGAPQGLGPLLYVLTATILSDVLAFLFGKRIGRRHWTDISPKKTVEGSLLAFVATVALAFAHWPLALSHLPWHGVLLAGVTVGIGAQVGDLTMALVKRNAGVKDFGNLLPGHGGITDRVNSLMITAPAFTHAIGFLYGPM
jgi:phosphatidate cytidylyltransferase